MAISPARRHFERVTAGNAQTDPATTTLKAQIAAKLTADLAALKQIQSRKAKIEAKRQMLPAYEAYVAGVIDADAGGDDEVLATILVWRIDVADWPAVLPLADYALRHNLTAPARFKRDLPTTIVEEPAEALTALLTGEASAQAVEAAASALDELLDLTANSDMADEVRAKAYKALALARKDTAPADALICAKTAASYDPKCGVKTLIQQLEKGNVPASDGTDDPPAPDAPADVPVSGDTHPDTTEPPTEASDPA